MKISAHRNQVKMQENLYIKDINLQEKLDKMAKLSI